MNRFATTLVVLSALAVAAPSFARNHEDADARRAHRSQMHDKWENASPEERTKMKAAHNAKWEKKMKNASPQERANMKARHGKRKNQARNQDGNWDARHQYPGENRRNRYEQGTYIGSAVKQH